MTDDDMNRMFAKIGRVSNAFASLELVLDEFLRDLIKPQDHRVSQTNPPSSYSFAKKTGQFQDLSLQRFAHNIAHSELMQLHSDLQSCGRKRNDILHSTYAGISGETKKLHQRWPQGIKRDKIVAGEKKAIDYGSFTLDEEELDTAIDEIEETEFRLITFMTTQYNKDTEPAH